MPPAQVPSAGSRRRKEQRYRSVISDIFDGSILSLVQCLTCDRVSAVGVQRDIQPSAASVELAAVTVGDRFSTRCPVSHTCQLVAGTQGALSAWSGQGGTLEGGDPG